MAGDFRGVYLIGNKLDKLVTAVLVQNFASGELSTFPLEEYVHRGIEPADGALPWEQDITPKPTAPQPDPSQWGASTWDAAAARIATSHSQRNDAVLNSGGSQVLPPLPPANSAATVDTPAGAGAGTAPREIRLETGAGEIRLEGPPPDAELSGAQRRVHGRQGSGKRSSC
jgi:hypothetical protein